MLKYNSEDVSVLIGALEQMAKRVKELRDDGIISDMTFHYIIDPIHEMSNDDDINEAMDMIVEDLMAEN